MATARKLPSGSWRCQAFDRYEVIRQPDGSEKKKRIYKSFTSDDPTRAGKKACELAAAQWAATRKGTEECRITFQEAAEEYIRSRKSVLSPRTIMDYKRILRSETAILHGIQLSAITRDDVQRCINADAAKHSPKTVRNTHGFISAVLKQYRPDLALNTSLPQRRKAQLYIPSDDDVKRLISASKGTEMELPILLAAFGPMRRGEIAALTTSNIHGNTVHVCANMVRTEDHKEWIVKTPKSYAGDRYIEFPDAVAALWSGKTGRVTNLTPNQITDRFHRLVKRLGLPHFRFHDLRHYSASIQHALGVPDVYIMQRGGWGNDTTLKTVYRHVIDSERQRMNRIAEEHFEKIMQHEMQHEKEKTP